MRSTMNRAALRTAGLPPTNVPPTPYERPMPVTPGSLRLDGNEGSVPSEALIAELERLETPTVRDYPDLGPLTEAIAERHDLSPENVVVTTGADGAMDRVFRAFARPGDELLVPTPTFEMIYRFAAIAGITVVKRPWLDKFPLREMAEAVSQRTTIVAVVSPNNPTGAVISRRDLAELSAAAPRSVLMFDHVYAEYADEDLTASALENPNSVVLRTFSKAWGLAGCRVGYALASAELAAVLRSAANPYPVAAPSAWLALRRLQTGRADMTAHVEEVRSERRRLAERLRERGIGCSDSRGNFLLAELGNSAALFRQRLAELGVLVRAFPHRREIATAVRISLPGNELHFSRLIETLDVVLDELGKPQKETSNDRS
jgi:histidinol-phosphate aminotransferase